MALHFDGGAIRQEDFLTGFERDEDVVGRPVDIAQGPDGAIYVSDDYAGVIYRIGYDNIKVSADADDAGAQTGTPDPLAHIKADDIAAFAANGATLFAANGCAACHIAAAAPEGTQVKVLENLSSRYSVEALMALLQTPPSPMPSFDLTPDERQDLAVFLLSREAD